MKFETLDLKNQIRFYEFMGMFYDYYLEVNEEDLSREVDWTTYAGDTIRTTALEARFDYLMKHSGKVQIAIEDDEIVGFLLYHMIFDCILVIRGMYAIPSHHNKSLGKKLIQSLDQVVTKVVFQTRKAKPPEQMLSVTKPYRNKIGENETMITWEMTWAADQVKKK